jgi:hypothetical protein
MADPSGGPVFCHNDVCLENVVFRTDEAVGLIDFDFAAPGRRVFDLSSFTRMCVPIDDVINSAKNGWRPSDRPRRLRLVADSYGLDVGERSDLIDLLAESIAKGGEFVLRHVEAGEPGSLRCGTRWAGWSASTVAGAGGPPHGQPSKTQWPDVTPPAAEAPRVRTTQPRISPARTTTTTRS